MKTDEYVQHRKYKVRLNIRTSHLDMPIRSGVKKFDGQIFNVQVLWKGERDDKYPGEWALRPLDFDFGGIHMEWIASGDVEMINEVVDAN